MRFTSFAISLALSGCRKRQLDNEVNIPTVNQPEVQQQHQLVSDFEVVPTRQTTTSNANVSNSVSGGQVAGGNTRGIKPSKVNKLSKRKPESHVSEKKHEGPNELKKEILIGSYEAEARSPKGRKPLERNPRFFVALEGEEDPRIIRFNMGDQDVIGESGDQKALRIVLEKIIKGLRENQHKLVLKRTDLGRVYPRRSEDLQAEIRERIARTVPRPTEAATIAEMTEEINREIERIEDCINRAVIIIKGQTFNSDKIRLCPELLRDKLQHSHGHAHPPVHRGGSAQADLGWSQADTDAYVNATLERMIEDLERTRQRRISHPKPGETPDELRRIEFCIDLARRRIAFEPDDIRELRERCGDIADS